MPYNFLKSVQLVLGLFVFAPLSGCITPTIENFDNSSHLGNSDKYLAFVGELVEIVEYDQDKEWEENLTAEEKAREDEDTIVIYMDFSYKVRYKILELVHGDYDRDVIDFKAFDHYGFPRFAKQKVVMLYLREYDDELFHVKYTYDVVFPTKEGRYAFCGNPYFNLDEEDAVEPPPLQDITFRPPVIRRISDYLPDEDDYAENQRDEFEKDLAWFNAYFSEPDFNIIGDHARCKRGVYADDIFRIKNEKRFRPQLREEHCESKLGISGFYLNDSGEGKAISACEAEMKRNNLP